MPNPMTFEQQLAEFRPRKLREISLDEAPLIAMTKSTPEFSSVFRYGTVALAGFLLGLATMYFVSPSNDETKQRSKGPSVLQPLTPMLDEQAIASLYRPADLLRVQSRPQPMDIRTKNHGDALSNWEEQQCFQSQALQRTLLRQEINQPIRRKQP